MQQMMQQITKIQCQFVNNNALTVNHQNGNNCYPNQQLYCWQYGVCNYCSKDCRNKAPI